MQGTAEYCVKSKCRAHGRLILFLIAVKSIVYLVFRTKVLKCSRVILRPAHKPLAIASQQQIERAVHIADWVQSHTVPGTRHRCLYRSYARAATLRRIGLPVTLNIGTRKNPAGEGDSLKGHCWLTLEDEILFEEDQSQKYPFRLGDTLDGVCYWLGINDPAEQRHRTND